MEIQILIFFLWIASSLAGWTCDDLLEDTLCEVTGFIRNQALTHQTLACQWL